MYVYIHIYIYIYIKEYMNLAAISPAMAALQPFQDRRRPHRQA